MMFTKLLKNIAVMFGLVTLLSLTGCESTMTPKLYTDTLNKNQAVQQEIARADMQNARVPYGNAGGVQTSDEFHLGDSPAWLYKSVTLRGSDIPLSVLMTRLLPANAIAQYDSSVDQNTLVQINYSGSVKGALDRIAAQINSAYDIEGSTLTWSAFVTKTFDISFMPGAAQYMMGGQSQVGANSSSSNNVAAGINTQDSQYSNLQGTLSVWSDLKDSINGMLSADGKVIVSQATTTITVRDHPQNVQVIADYLASMNKDLSRQVLLKVRVLEVDLNKSFNYGINWNLVYNAYAAAAVQTGDLSQSVGLSALGNTAPMGPSIGSLATSSMSGIGTGILSGPFANTAILINALQQQGSVSTVTNPQVMTLNNQVAQIEITRQTSYVASTTSTVTGVSGTAQFSINPGVVSTGFTLYVLPKIEGNNIYLQLTSDLSTLDSLTSQTEGSKDAGNLTTVALPVVSGKHFNIRSMVKSGDTLIIAGFKQTKNQAAKSSMFGIALFGGSAAASDNAETVILITPVLAGNM